MDRYDDITSGDIRELAALISGYTDEAVVTDEEVTAVIAWCREWVADCEWIAKGEEDNMSTATLLRCCNRHVVGGLSFVLADVRLCATPANRELADWGTLADSAASLAARRCELAREGDPAAFEPVDALQSRADELNEDASTRAAIIERADALGYDAGIAAGSWVIDGNTDAEDAASLLRMTEDGDPAAYDALPSSPLSGEYADDTLPRDVLESLDMDEDDDRAEDVLRAFEDGYSRGVMDEVVRSCRALLPDADEEDADHVNALQHEWDVEMERDEETAYCQFTEALRLLDVAAVHRDKMEKEKYPTQYAALARAEAIDYGKTQRGNAGAVSHCEGVALGIAQALRVFGWTEYADLIDYAADHGTEDVSRGHASR